MSDDEIALGGFVEAVESFFTSGGNGDEVPQSDGNIISLCKREVRRAGGAGDRKKARLRYAYALTLSPKPDDVEKGIELLEGSLNDCDEPHKSILLIAYGYFKIDKYQESNDNFKLCINMEPSWVLPKNLNNSLTLARKSDYLMSHLLRVACFFSQETETLTNSLLQITSELHRKGLVSDNVLELSSHSIMDFNVAFDDVLQENIDESDVHHFWTLASLRTRYLRDFQQLKELGKGGFATVYLCKNRHDLREYALKLIKAKTHTDSLKDAMLREVQALSGLQHHHVVRYYQAWIEQVVKGSGQTLPGSGSEAEDSLNEAPEEEATHEPEPEIDHCLYIQMEYCPRTLRDHLDAEGYKVDEDFACKTIRQLLDGLSYIHEENIIHRDLTPRNIFFDSHLDVKIGDFGLAKFLDKDDSGVIITSSKSSSASQKLGTALYLAPEIVNGSKNIDQKVDIFSLGMVIFEIWHPFGTLMERLIVLEKLRDQGILPSAWELEHTTLAAVLRRMLSRDPAERPTVRQLRTDFGF